MKEMKFVFGPVPSRRLGISLGISPIPKKTCNYSCVYCQLGRTNRMSNERKMFFPVNEIMDDFNEILKAGFAFDVVTIVGEGEPTLYLGMGELIEQLKEQTSKPIAVITNGALLYEPQLRRELAIADIVLPTMDAYDERTLNSINRPHKEIHFPQVFEGLKIFSQEYLGQLWIEIMLIAGVNDDDVSLHKYAEMLAELNYQRLYLNTPIRPPAEKYVKQISEEKMSQAVEVLGGISLDFMVSEGFQSNLNDSYEAIMSIIKRHPMNQFEIKSFLKMRNEDAAAFLHRLESDIEVKVVDYKGYRTYRLR